jgi:LPXTG-motif cell wall-anchored protein
MKAFSRIHSPAFALICGMALVSGFAASRARADEWNKKTILTVNEPVQVSDTVLDPGKYVLMLENSSSDRHIVQIFDANQSHLINTVMATPNYRLRPTGNSRFMFWETPPGTAKALRAWFYPGDNFGQEFRYPAHPYVLQASAAAPTPAATNTQPPQQPAPQEEVTPPAPEANAQPQAEPAPVQTAPEQEQPEVAQNNPPPAPAPAAQPAPEQQQPKSNELPQTASPYPLIGLSGAALLGLAGLLRLKRVA